MTIDENFKTLRRIVRTHGKYVMGKLFDDYLTRPRNKKITPSCILCGTGKNLTKEHVLPKLVFQSNDKHSFTSDVNQLSHAYIRATVPACRSCNSDLLNSIEQYIQKTLSEVDLKTVTIVRKNGKMLFVGWKLLTLSFRFGTLLRSSVRIRPPVTFPF